MDFFFGSEKDEFHDETVHFIWSGYEANDRCFGDFAFRAEIIHIFYKIMIEHGIHKPFMITFVWRIRDLCRTKEEYEAAYNSECKTGDKYRDSIGDHLENFIEDLKNNKYCFENLGLESMDTSGYFHYAMLTRQEEREIKIPDSDFLNTFFDRNPDVPDVKMAKSDSNHKYVRSSCVRSTYII